MAASTLYLHQDEPLQPPAVALPVPGPAPAVALALVGAGRGPGPVHHHAPAPAPVPAAGEVPPPRARGEAPAGEGEGGEVRPGAAAAPRALAVPAVCAPAVRPISRASNEPSHLCSFHNYI